MALSYVAADEVISPPSEMALPGQHQTTQELNDFQAVTDTGQMKGQHVFCFRKFMCGCVVLLIQNWQGIELEQKQAMFLEDDFSPE